MAEAESGIRVADGGVTIGRTFGAKRLKALLFLSQHPEIDGGEWSGQVLLHFGGKMVKAAVHPAVEEINLDAVA